MAASQALTNASSAECAQALAWKCGFDLLGNVVLTKIDDAGIRQREPIIKLIVPAGGAVAIGVGLWSREGVPVATSSRLGFGKGPHGAMKTGLWASADYLGPQSHPNPSWRLGFWPGRPAVFAGGAVAIGLGLVEGRRPRGCLRSAWL